MTMTDDTQVGGITPGALHVPSERATYACTDCGTTEPKRHRDVPHGPATVEAAQAVAYPVTAPMLSVLARLRCGWCSIPMAALPLHIPECQPVWRGKTVLHPYCVDAYERDQDHREVQARPAKRYRRGERQQ